MAFAKVGVVKPVQVMENRDIPPNTLIVLERLFDIIGQFDDDTIEWARDRIEELLDLWATTNAVVRVEGTDATL